ncbi:hypothetical protein F53441_81 [Fusarium austroafricanum]|uniref:Uncharacterized protein n=1 Tax=Fusarium austroafricanum TaxID=2364996 RepID=A0A8H4P6Q5_9HYPO|nr:hypothetical protein F53441_81 [Fusarium austroafricanum]
MPSSALVTPLPVFAQSDHQAPLVAEVIGADATATTYVLNCPYVEPDSEEARTAECGAYNNTYTLGPWMSKTLPPGAASTGNFDLYISMPYEEPWKFSVHCEMSRTVATKCVTTNIGGNDDGHPTSTITNTDELDGLGFGTVAFGPVTITAGLELLNAKHTGAATATATGIDATKASSEASGSEASSAATPVNTSGASSSFVRFFGALSAAGFAAALVMF